MNKNYLIIAIVAVVVLLGVFWLVRSRAVVPTDSDLSSTSVGEDALGLPRAAPVELDVEGTPAASPSGVTSGVTPSASPVIISSTSFSPATITISVGGSVTFTNGDSAAHQVMSAPHPVHTNFPPLNVGVIGAGESRTVVFAQSGTFLYHDHLNPGITGKVVVQ